MDFCDPLAAPVHDLPAATPKSLQTDYGPYSGHADRGTI